MLRKIMFGLVAILSAYNSPVEAAGIPKTEIACMTQNIYHEVRGEPLKAQIAVSHVVMNRIKSGKFGKTACEVIHQKNQFSWVKMHLKIRDKKAYDALIPIAEQVYYGKISDPTHGSTYFRNKRLTVRVAYVTIGHMIFYKA